MKKYEKLYPQLVEVVNEIKASIDAESEVPVKLPSSLIQHIGDNNDLLKSAVGNSNTWVFAKPSAGYYNVHVCALYLVEAKTGFVTVVPIGSDYYNLSVAQIGVMENGFHILNVMYPSTTSAKVVYTKIGNNMEAETIVYSLQ